MRIELVTVCVDYADFLAETLPLNAPLVDDMLVVTTERDQATRQLCRKHCIRTVLTDEFYYRGAPFAKARGIVKGLEQLTRSDWVLHMDADTALPSQFRRLLSQAQPKEDTLYGADRVMINSYQEWQEYKRNWLNIHDYCHRVNIPPYKVGTRFVHDAHGYCPIGFFQLWHGSQDTWCGINSRRYPMTGNTAARNDVQFALLFDRDKRAILPEIVVAHIESEVSPKGINWNGRKSKPLKADNDSPNPSSTPGKARQQNYPSLS